MKEKYYENYILKLEEIYDPNYNMPKEEESSNILVQMHKPEPNLAINLDKLKEKQNFKKIEHFKEEWDELLSLQKQNETNMRKNMVCRNNTLMVKLMDKMQDGLLSTIIVYFDDIFTLLIDEILEEEV